MVNVHCGIDLLPPILSTLNPRLTAETMACPTNQHTSNLSGEMTLQHKPYCTNIIEDGMEARNNYDKVI